jgi:acetyl-CoA carboxylase carboxyltransferase component
MAGWSTFSQDFTVFGGSLGEVHAEKIVKIMDMALKNGAPIIGLERFGRRAHPGRGGLAGGYAEIFLRNTLASGVIPQISAIMGPCAGGAVYSPALTDFIFMVRNTSYMFVTGPEVVKTVTHEEVSFEDLGGASVHGEKSGVCHVAADSEADTLYLIRKLLGYLPQNNMEDPPFVGTGDDPLRDGRSLDSIIPDEPNKPYDIKEIIRMVVDNGQFFEIHEGMPERRGRLCAPGRALGRDCRQPAGGAGGCAGYRRFGKGRALRALLRRVQHPDPDPGRYARLPARHRAGARRDHPHGAKLLYAYCEATVPKLTVITRKAYGGAYDVMSSKHIRGDINLAWPTAEIAVMGPEGAVNIIFRKRNGKGRRPGQAQSGAGGRIPREIRQSLRGRRTRLHRRCDRTARDPRRA